MPMTYTEADIAKLAFSAIVNTIDKFQDECLRDDSKQDFEVTFPDNIQINGNTYVFIKLRSTEIPKFE
jgi:hypothetical protein